MHPVGTTEGALVEQQRPQRKNRRLRRWFVGVMIVLSCLMTVAATVAVWARAEVLDTDRWVATVGPLIDEPAVVDALSTRAAIAIVDGLDLENRIRDALVNIQQLPDQIGALAAPITDAIEGRIKTRVTQVLETDQAQQLWVEINRVAHTAIVNVLTGNTREGISVENGTVTLDLIPVIALGLSAVEDILSDILGRPIDLPDPADLDPANVAEAKTRIESALGIQLPEDFGQVVVFRSDRLAAAQDLVSAVNRGITVVIVLAVLFMALALVFSLNRRRTLIELGLGVFIAFLISRLAIRAIGRAVVQGVQEGNQNAARDVVNAVFGSLIGFTTFLFVAGLFVGIGAYLAGRPAWLLKAREHLRLAPERETPFGAWIKAHRDLVRFGSVAVALLVLLIVEISWASVLWVALALILVQIAVSYLAGPPEPETAEEMATTPPTSEPGSAAAG
jgi:hypothetical protein